MVEVALTSQRVEPEKVPTLREWIAERRDREAEVAESLRERNVYTETAFLRETDDGTFLVYYVEAEDVEAAREAFPNPDREIDRRHREVLADVLDDAGARETADPLHHVTSPERPARPE
ncbi:MAG: DUF6176 family protein [Halorientalis sp.]